MAVRVYKATILPILDYNDMIYGLLTKQQLVKLQRVQNKALRTVFWGRSLSVDDMHSEAKVEYLEKRREAHLLALMLDRSGEDRYRDSTVRNTRSAAATLLKVPHPRTNKLKKSPGYRGTTLWNDLPA